MCVLFDNQRGCDRVDRVGFPLATIPVVDALAAHQAGELLAEIFIWRQPLNA
jgi:hypothetical protein